MINLHDTLSLMTAVEQIKPPETFLVDTFFPNTPPTSLSTRIAVEYSKQGRTLAPYIVPGSRGVNIGRVGSKFNIYEPPMVGVRRVINPADIEGRAFGETPVFSNVTPEQRASMMQARDLRDLLAMIQNRKNKMAADILTTGKTVIEGFADDGKTVKIDEIEFDWDGEITITTDWDQPNATIYDDIKNASEKIQEDTGMIPTLMLCGKKVEKYLLDNAEIFKWLNVPSAQNMSILSLQPRIVSPLVRRVGMIYSLNLEIYVYSQTYTDDDGTVKPFLGENDVIIAVPGRGKQLYGAITLVDDAESGFKTYSSPTVPQYTVSKEANTMSLAVFSRFLLSPSIIDDFVHIKVKS